MTYIVVVLAQTLVLPIVSGAIALDSHAPLAVLATFGRWFLFFGVGTRLVLAGVVQIVKPDFTTSEILADSPAHGSTIAQELGFANISMGAGAIIGTFLGGGLAAAICGGAYMGFAGVRHLGNKGMGAKELVATWTDLLIFAAMVGYAIALLAC